MSDPLDRDKYPNRPDSPAFWALSECVLWADGHASEGDFLDAIREFIDPEVAEYFATQRGMRLATIDRLASLWLDKTLVAAFAALWLDGFVAGAKFQKDHGK